MSMDKPDAVEPDLSIIQPAHVNDSWSVSSCSSASTKERTVSPITVQGISPTRRMCSPQHRANNNGHLTEADIRAHLDLPLLCEHVYTNLHQMSLSPTHHNHPDDMGTYSIPPNNKCIFVSRRDSYHSGIFNLNV